MWCQVTADWWLKQQRKLPVVEYLGISLLKYQPPEHPVSSQIKSAPPCSEPRFPLLPTHLLVPKGTAGTHASASPPHQPFSPLCISYRQLSPTWLLERAQVLSALTLVLPRWKPSVCLFNGLTTHRHGRRRHLLPCRCLSCSNPSTTKVAQLTPTYVLIFLHSVIVQTGS